MDQNNAPLISVIVPIYNVERYVRRCLDSLRGLSLKQIEVIMVDDGSTDESGRIADEYVTAPDVWPRFRIIHHRANRGLSAARNTGIDEAEAEWIMFVDSDDWVEPDFCMVPYESAVAHNADLVIFERYLMNKRGRIKHGRQGFLPTGFIDRETAIDHGLTVVWNKLYKKSLFSTIRYPEGRVYEDIATTHRIVYKAARILYLSIRLYTNVDRDGSISHRNTKENVRDRFISVRDRYDDLIAYGYPEEKLRNSLLSAAIVYVSVVPRDNDGLYSSAITIVDSTQGIPKRITRKQKMVLVLWKTNKRLFYWAVNNSRKMRQWR